MLKKIEERAAVVLPAELVRTACYSKKRHGINYASYTCFLDDKRYEVQFFGVPLKCVCIRKGFEKDTAQHYNI